MDFWGKVSGPLYEGGNMFARIRVHDKNMRLFNPPGVVVDVRVEGSSWSGTTLFPGGSGKPPGECEFAPLMKRNVYIFRLRHLPTGKVLSEWARCDMNLPIRNVADQGAMTRFTLWATGQVHKVFYVDFFEGEPPPLPPPGPGVDLESIRQHAMAIVDEIDQGG